MFILAQRLLPSALTCRPRAAPPSSHCQPSSECREGLQSPLPPSTTTLPPLLHSLTRRMAHPTVQGCCGTTGLPNCGQQSQRRGLLPVSAGGQPAALVRRDRHQQGPARVASRQAARCIASPGALVHHPQPWMLRLYSTSRALPARHPFRAVPITPAVSPCLLQEARLCRRRGQPQPGGERDVARHAGRRPADPHGVLAARLPGANGGRVPAARPAQMWGRCE